MNIASAKATHVSKGDCFLIDSRTIVMLCLTSPNDHRAIIIADLHNEGIGNRVSDVNFIGTTRNEFIAYIMHHGCNSKVEYIESLNIA